MAISILLAFCVACGGSGGAEPAWEVMLENQPGSLLSVWGASAQDVWVVGSDARDGTGPLVFRIRDGQVERLETGETSGDLWWVFGFAGGPVFMGGSGGMILRYENETFTRMSTPGVGTVFGIWGSSPTDMWAVGGASDGSSDGFAWRIEGDAWVNEPTLPADVAQTGTVWKVHGIGADDAWLVGSNGLSFHWDGETLTTGDTGVGSSLFTVYSTADRYVAVGGLASGIIVENDGESWSNVTPDPLPSGLKGVYLDEGGGGYAVGDYGAVFERLESGWKPVKHHLDVYPNLHAVWMDSEGGVWAVGGTNASTLTGGMLITRRPF